MPGVVKLNEKKWKVEEQTDHLFYIKHVVQRSFAPKQRSSYVIPSNNHARLPLFTYIGYIYTLYLPCWL